MRDARSKEPQRVGARGLSANNAKTGVRVAWVMPARNVGGLRVMAHYRRVIDKADLDFFRSSTVVTNFNLRTRMHTSAGAGCVCRRARYTRYTSMRCRCFIIH